VSSSQPHILFIASWYPHKHAPTQGIFIRRHALVASQTHRISVVFAYGDALLLPGETRIDIITDNGITEIRIAFSTQTASGKLLGKWIKSRRYKTAIASGIEKAIAKNGYPSIFHLHVIWRGIVGLLPIIKKYNLPLLISEHWSGYLPEDGNYRGFLLKYYTRQAMKLASHVTVVSKRMQDAMERHGLHANYSILHNVVDTSVFQLPVQKSAHETQFRLIHVSSLVDREKNCRGLFRIMKHLQQHSSVHLHIIGDGPERMLHEAYVKQLDIEERVHFKGALTPLGVAQAMQQADALILFSHFEGMPCVIAEAQCCGLPVLATRVGEIPQMVDSTQGLLVDPSDESAMVDAILEVQKNKKNFDAKQIHDRAIVTYGSEAVSSELVRLYSSMIK
jgi:glycosyltransferase involved in cell wall biosynthesis